MDKSVERAEGVLVYNPKTVPHGAIQLNPSEALALRLQIINSWNKPLEVLPLKFGGEAVTVATFFSSLLVTYRSRSFFNMFTRVGLALSLVPCVFLPTGIAHHCFTRFVSNQILVGPSNSMLYPDCSICLQIREALIMVSYPVHNLNIIILEIFLRSYLATYFVFMYFLHVQFVLLLRPSAASNLLSI